MAMAARLLSRSRQLYASQAVIQRGAVHIRSYATPAAPSKDSPLKGDEILKGIFYDVKNKFDTALRILKTEKITIDPDDTEAVAQYAKVMKTIKKEAGIPSIQNIIEKETKEIPDARTYLLTLQEIRVKNGLVDELGAENMMMQALEKVEKDIKKPLLRSDKKNMGLLLAEFEKINKKLGIRKEDLPKYEEKLELEIAKEQLQELKSNAIEAMETLMKREEFKDEKLPDVRSLDIRNFI